MGYVCKLYATAKRVADGAVLARVPVLVYLVLSGVASLLSLVLFYDAHPLHRMPK